MPKGATGPASEFSQQVADRVAQVRDDLGMSTTDLAEKSGMSRNYLYMRLRGDAPFTTNDIEGLALALGVDPIHLMTGGAELADRSLVVRLDPVELKLRLEEIVDASYGRLDSKSKATLLSSLSLAGSAWDALLAGDEGNPVERAVLVKIAQHFDVDERFLLEFGNLRVADLVRARLELQKTLRIEGAQHFHARALGEASPAALRAVARAISPQDRS